MIEQRSVEIAEDNQLRITRLHGFSMFVDKHKQSVTRAINVSQKGAYLSVRCCVRGIDECDYSHI